MQNYSIIIRNILTTGSHLKLIRADIYHRLKSTLLHT